MNTPYFHVASRLCPVCRGYTYYSPRKTAHEPARCERCFATIPGIPPPRIEIRDYPKESQPMPNPNKCMKCDAPCDHPMFYCDACLAERPRERPAVRPDSNHAPNPVHDPVNHPKHYTSHPSGVECIQITEHMSFNLGNAVKYLWRADEKGTPITDLEKAVWYITREIAKRQRAADSMGQGNLEV